MPVTTITTTVEAFLDEVFQPITTLQQRMQALIDSFPSLYQAGLTWEGDNCHAFVAQSRGLVNAYDRQAAAFICYVWNKYDAPKGTKFNFQKAIEAWDQPHVEALRAWLANPWYA
jgi:hypothetical protein